MDKSLRDLEVGKENFKFFKKLLLAQQGTLIKIRILILFFF